MHYIVKVYPEPPIAARILSMILGAYLLQCVDMGDVPYGDG
jgi:hypothetical protein